MDIRATGIRLIIISIVFILPNININPQSHYLDSYPGIPIIAHTNSQTSQLTQANYYKMRELGVLGFYANELTPQTYITITQAGLKVFPYQIYSTDNNLVVYYTDAIYTVWEAEGKGTGSDGDMQLYRDSSITTEFTEGNDKGIKTTSSDAGNLIYGPYYYQYVQYKIIPDTTNISYHAKFRLKILNTIPIQNLPSGYLYMPVCTLKVVATNPELVGDQKEYLVTSRILYVSDFLNAPEGNGWNQWGTFETNTYTLTNLVNLSEQQLKSGFELDKTSVTYDTRWMQYKIDWAGVSFLDLCVDNITVYDFKGELLKTDTDIQDDIKEFVGQYEDTSKVLGWFGLNEPQSIDNYEPFRMVDSLIQSVNPNLRLFTTYATGWGGIYGMPYPGSFDASKLSSGVYIYNIQTDAYIASKKMILMK